MESEYTIQTLYELAKPSEDYLPFGPTEEDREKYHNLSGLFDCGCGLH